MTRRANGEGTIGQRNDGRWQARVSLATGGRKCIYGRTKAEVVAKMRAVLRQVDEGIRPGREDITVAGMLGLWLDATGDRGKPSYREATERIVRLHLSPPPLGRKRIGRLTADDVEAWQRAKLAETTAVGERRSPTHVRTMHVTLRLGLAWAVRRRLIPANVATQIPLPAPSSWRGTAWTADEALAVLAAATDDPLEALWVMGLTTAMRQGELLGLRWEAVDLDRARVAVETSLERHGTRTAIGTPKSERSRRVVPLTELAIRSLRRHRARQAERRLTAQRWDDLGLVFPNSIGRPLNPSTLRTRAWLPLIERAGVRRVRFHDMRDTTASLLYALGGDDRLIADLLGHASVETTHRHYVHVRPDDPRLLAVVGRLGSALTPVLTPTPATEERRGRT